MASILPQTVFDAIDLYSKTNSQKSLKNLKTVLRRYVLPRLTNYEFFEHQLEGNKILTCLSLVSIQDFRRFKPERILAAQLEALIEAKVITKRTADGYRSELIKFIKWMQQQDWYIEAARTWDGKCAPLIRLKADSDLQYIKQSKQQSINKSPYALKESELTDKVKEEMESFCLFWTGKEVEERQESAIRPVTLKRRKDHVLFFLGWLKNIEGWSDDALSLKLLDDVKLLKKMVAWGINLRGNSYAWAVFQAAASLSVAKWLHAHESEKAYYRDIESVEKIRIYQASLQDKYKPSLAKEDKELTHEQCVAMVKHLKQCTVPKTRNWVKRSLRAVMLSWQKYLIISILTYCPIRGREIRELQLNRTLIKDEKGYWLNLRPEDHKTGSQTGEGRKLNLSEWLPPEVISDLDEWLTVWRPKVWEIIKDLDAWLEFWKHERSQLETLSLKIQQKQQTGDQRNLDALTRELRGLKQLIEVWDEVKVRPYHNYVFFSLGSNVIPETICRPYCDPDPDLDKKVASHFCTTIKGAVRTATAVLIESGHPLFVGLNPKATNPHFFRHIDSTHIRRIKANPNIIQAFHKGIGNSPEEGDRSYSLLTPEEKTADGAAWWKVKDSSNDVENVEQIRKLIAKLSPEDRRKLGL